MTNPALDRVPRPVHRLEEPSFRSRLSATPDTGRVNEDATDGPVDLWVDDVDGDWDDLLAPDSLATERFLMADPEPVATDQ